MPKFIFLADESGHVTQDPGAADNIGPSRYLTMGGCLIEESRLDVLRARLEEIREKFGKSKHLHAADISHVQKIYLIREMNEFRIPYFAVVSDKQTLGGFKKRSEGSPHDYYNRTALYLLSCLGRYMRLHNCCSKDVRIIFEARRHDYDRFRNYIGKVKKNPTGNDVDGIQEISNAQIETEKKENEHLLVIPDMIAHALFSAFDRNAKNFGITEVRYLYEMLDRFREDNVFSRLYPIQRKKIRGVCKPTADLMVRCGHALGE